MCGLHDNNTGNNLKIRSPPQLLAPFDKKISKKNYSSVFVLFIYCMQEKGGKLLFYTNTIAQRKILFNKYIFYQKDRCQLLAPLFSILCASSPCKDNATEPFSIMF